MQLSTLRWLYQSGMEPAIACTAVVMLTCPVRSVQAQMQLQHAATPHADLAESHEHFWQVEVGHCILAQTDDSRSPARLARAVAVAVRGGFRWDNLGVHASLDLASWRSPRRDGSSEVAAALSPGIGAELLMGEGRLRSSLTVGPSILLLPTQVDDAWSVGFFLDARPVGVRFSLDGDLRLGFDPITFTLLIPEPSGIPLLELEYRTTVYLEQHF